MTQGVEALRGRVKKEIVLRYSKKRLYPIWPFKEFGLDEAWDAYNVVSGLLEKSKEKVLDSWDETTAAMAQVVVSERSWARAIANHEAEQARLNKR